MQVTEQILKALGIHTCSDLIANRGLISALFKPLTVDFFIRSGLGFGQTGHSAPLESGAVGRRGMSVERTFPAASSPADLEAWVSILMQIFLVCISAGIKLHEIRSWED